MNNTPTFAAELTWNHLDQQYQSSVASQLARYALGLRFDMLPDEVVHQAKRILLDTIGCAIGGCVAPGRTICEDVAEELGGREEATIIGSGKRTSAIGATMVNAFLVRFLDYNDVLADGAAWCDAAADGTADRVQQDSFRLMYDLIGQHVEA